MKQKTIMEVYFNDYCEWWRITKSAKDYTLVFKEVGVGVLVIKSRQVIATGCLYLVGKKKWNLNWFFVVITRCPTVCSLRVSKQFLSVPFSAFSTS